MKTNDEIERAIATYDRPVTKYPAGKARGDKPIKRAGPDLNAAGWQAPPPDESEKRREMRMARAKRQRIAERNAPMLERIEKQDRKAERNMAIIKRENER